MKQGRSRKFRKSFSKKHLFGTVRRCFVEIEEPIVGRGYTLLKYVGEKSFGVPATPQVMVID